METRAIAGGGGGGGGRRRGVQRGTVHNHQGTHARRHHIDCLQQPEEHGSDRSTHHLHLHVRHATLDYHTAPSMSLHGLDASDGNGLGTTEPLHQPTPSATRRTSTAPRCPLSHVGRPTAGPAEPRPAHCRSASRRRVGDDAHCSQGGGGGEEVGRPWGPGGSREDLSGWGEWSGGGSEDGWADRGGRDGMERDERDEHTDHPNGPPPCRLLRRSSAAEPRAATAARPTWCHSLRRGGKPRARRRRRARNVPRWGHRFP